MANPDHVEKLAKGAVEWNSWRVWEPESVPDFTGADFAGARLAGADLSDTDFTGAKLAGADFSNAKFHRAILTGADITGARLTGARLFEADMRGAVAEKGELSGANLAGACVRDANFTDAVLAQARLAGADLGGARLAGADLIWADCAGANFAAANLAGARLYRTNFGGCALTGAAGVDGCRHLGPATLDPLALRRAAPLPDDFLAGCGLLRAAMADAQTSGWFIAHAAEDAARATALMAALRDRGTPSWCWEEPAEGGRALSELIGASFGPTDRLVAISTDGALGQRPFLRELELGLIRDNARRRMGYAGPHLALAATPGALDQWEQTVRSLHPQIFEEIFMRWEHAGADDLTQVPHIALAEDPADMAAELMAVTTGP